MRIWLHRWEGNASGWNAWSLDHVGFATWAPSRDGVLEKVRGKFAAHCAWLEEHGHAAADDDVTRLVIVEEIAGDEVAFEHDLAPATDEEVARCVVLLACSRQSLLATLASLTDDVLDWDPPYERFEEWAWWKTARQIVAHIALCEVGYYLPRVRWRVPFDPDGLRDVPWREQLDVSRAETLRFLADLSASDDRTRLRGRRETWSARKVLRRLVWHELVHWKSIRRIVGAWEER